MPNFQKRTFHNGPAAKGKRPMLKFPLTFDGGLVERRAQPVPEEHHERVVPVVPLVPRVLRRDAARAEQTVGQRLVV